MTGVRELRASFYITALDEVWKFSRQFSDVLQYLEEWLVQGKHNRFRYALSKSDAAVL